jgi:multiple RNA-binding domain-containing protein 1
LSCDVVDERTATETITQSILDTGRLFIRNLSYVCTETHLQTLLGQFGELADIAFVVDKHTGKCKGFAVVTFVFPENAVAAYAALDGTIFMGRMLHILPGEEKRDDDKDPSSIALSTTESSSSFKRQLAVRQRANLGNVHTWNTLFLGANAIADTIANKFGASKSDLLSGDNDASAGVRLALGETRLVRETREFMLANGVQLDAFSRPNAKRSDTVIIAKNLPAGVSADELRRMFERYGEVGRVLLPAGEYS